MRERLIELLDNATVEKVKRYPNGTPALMYCEKAVNRNTAIQLADKILADGWIRPPVWVGNTVWFYVPHKDKPFELRKGRVSRVEYTLSGKPLLTIRYNDNTLDFAREYWGNRAFATESEARTAMEEAEAALRKEDKGK